jgi:hypothetical protein
MLFNLCAWGVLLRGCFTYSPAIGAGIPAIAVGIPAIAVGIPAIAVGIPAIGADIPAIGADIPAIRMGIPAIGVGVALGVVCRDAEEEMSFEYMITGICGAMPRRMAGAELGPIDLLMMGALLLTTFPSVAAVTRTLLPWMSDTSWVAVLAVLTPLWPVWMPLLLTWIPVLLA